MISDLNIYVNRDLCYACGICVDRCIMDNLRLSIPPCRKSCPLSMNCMGYVRLIAQGKEREAAEEMRLYTPFGGILGRVCASPCEGICERGRDGGAVHLRALKRYLAESFPDVANRVPELPDSSGMRVAVVGSGPGGLSAAYELRARGHEVTVYESADEPGGFLRRVIPEFRLPVAEVDRAVGMLERMGIVFRTGAGVGDTIGFGELERAHDAVVVAIGAAAPAPLRVPGADDERVIQGLTFLAGVKSGRIPQLGPSVVVIGGGNTAVDAALTCRRLGVPRVEIVCLERADEMPAFDEELLEAKEEGVEIHPCWGPTGIARSTGGVLEIELSRCSSLNDEHGRFAPMLEPGCGLRRTASTVILAVGQDVSARGLPEALVDGASGRVRADSRTGRSPVSDRVFVCGDCATGPSSVVDAMASGKRTAESVDRAVRGDSLTWGRDACTLGHTDEYEVDRSGMKGGPRGTLERLPRALRTPTSEVERTMSPDRARAEAERCLGCGRAAEINKTCWFCLPCEIECPVKALEVRMPYQVR